MSNDPLPWLAEELRLIRQVTRNPVPEIGWSVLHVDASEQARDWLGVDNGSFPAYQWHGETFSLPEKAVRIMANKFCANQVFVRGPHLGMQCHIEMTKELIEGWIEGWSDAFAEERNLVDSVQPPSQQLMQSQARLREMRVLSTAFTHAG